WVIRDRETVANTRVGEGATVRQIGVLRVHHPNAVRPRGIKEARDRPKQMGYVDAPVVSIEHATGSSVIVLDVVHDDDSVDRSDNLGQRFGYPPALPLEHSSELPLLSMRPRVSITHATIPLPYW